MADYLSQLAHDRLTSAMDDIEKSIRRDFDTYRWTTKIAGINICRGLKKMYEERGLLVSYEPVKDSPGVYLLTLRLPTSVTGNTRED